MDQEQLSGQIYKSQPNEEQQFVNFDFDELEDYPDPSFNQDFNSNKQSSFKHKSSLVKNRFQPIYDNEQEQQQLSDPTLPARTQKATQKSNTNFAEDHSQYSFKNHNLDQQEQLSDCRDRSDQQVSQYQATLFAEMRSHADVKSIVSFPSQKQNSSNYMQKFPETVKQSDATNDDLTKKDSKKQMLLARFKKQKKQKFLEDSSTIWAGDKAQGAGRRQKVENKKRFSKKQLQLVSRKFADYYAYQTKKQYQGEKITLRSIGQAFQLGHATVHKLYAEWMDDPYFYQRIKRYDKYRKQTKNPQRRLTLDRLQHITRLIKENPFLTQHQLCVQLNKIEELKIIKGGQRQNMTRTIVGKLLKMGKFSKKRVKCIPKQKNTSKSLQKRYQYCLKYKEILERGAKVYFLDESGFNLYMTRDKAWSRPNQQITVNCPISKGKRFSLIAMIGEDGLAHWRFIQGNYRKFQYLDFIREMFQKLIDVSKLQEEQEQQRWIVMDNCAIHDKQQTINLAKEHGVNVLYLPSYSPQLNPIENWFHEIKCKLKKINYSGQKQLFTIMQNFLKQYEKHSFTAYYHGSLRFVEKGLKKEKF